MALPSKIKTATLTFGSAVSVSGADRRIDVYVTPRFNGVTGDIVWAETQTIIHLEPISGQGSPADTVNIVVPIDQPGFLSSEGFQIPVGSIAYVCTVRVNGQTSYEKLVHPTRENELIDVDGIVSAKDVVQQLGSIPIVRSVTVNGAKLTGDVSLDGLQVGTGGGTGGGIAQSNYDLWISAGNSGTVQDYLEWARGKDGASTFDLAVQGGYVGTRDQWLESQKGAKGDQGKQGDPGPVTSIKTLNAAGTAYVTPTTAPAIYLSTTANAPTPAGSKGDLWLQAVI